MSRGSSVYNVLCFTTNNKSFMPLSILEKYLTSSGYDQKNIIRLNPLDFYYSINSKKILLSFHEIINLNQEKTDICFFADSYLILIDLEKDNTYQILSDIINFMNNLCDLEKTVFVLGLYMDAKNIKNNLNEENIKEFLDKKKLIYEYFESNVAITSDFNKTINFIIEEGIKKAEKKLKDGEMNNNKIDSDSRSHCDIF